MKVPITPSLILHPYASGQFPGQTPSPAPPGRPSFLFSRHCAAEESFWKRPWCHSDTRPEAASLPVDTPTGLFIALTLLMSTPGPRGGALILTREKASEGQKTGSSGPPLFLSGAVGSVCLLS